MWINGPLFVYFCPFLITISIIQIEKRLDRVLGIWTRGRRMVGADETPELWQLPQENSFLLFCPCLKGRTHYFCSGNFPIGKHCISSSYLKSMSNSVMFKTPTTRAFHCFASLQIQLKRRIRLCLSKKPGMIHW